MHYPNPHHQVCGLALLCGVGLSACLSMGKLQDPIPLSELNRSRAAEHNELQRLVQESMTQAYLDGTRNLLAPDEQMLEARLQALMDALTELANLRSLTSMSWFDITGDAAIPPTAVASRVVVDVDPEQPGPVALADCASSRVVVSPQLLRDIARFTLEDEYDAPIEELLTKIFGRYQPIEVSDQERFYLGEALVDNPLLIHRLIESDLTIEKAVVHNSDRRVFKSLAFLLAHEASHIWVDGCQRLPKEQELRADAFASLIASDLFLQTCYSRDRLLPTEVLSEVGDELVSLLTEEEEIVWDNDEFQNYLGWNKGVAFGVGAGEFLEPVFTARPDRYHFPVARRAKHVEQIEEVVFVLTVDSWSKQGLVGRIVRSGYEPSVANVMRGDLLCPQLSLEQD